MLRGAGFGDVACYGNLDGGPFGAETRLVLVATATERVTEGSPR
jgi:hypothetical protein